jgi:anti-sigma factor RsiW
MRCKEFVELVTDYLDGALAAADKLRFEAHLEHCPWCGRYFEQMRVTISVVGRLDRAGG